MRMCTARSRRASACAMVVLPVPGRPERIRSIDPRSSVRRPLRLLTLDTVALHAWNDEATTRRYDDPGGQREHVDVAAAGAGRHECELRFVGRVDGMGVVGG